MKASILGEVGQIAVSTSKMMTEWIADRKLDVKNWGRQKVVETSIKDSFVGKSARKTANQMLAELKQEYNYYEDLCIADVNGNLIASSNAELIGKVKVADRAYFKQAMQGEMPVSDVIKSKGTGNPVFVIASPIKEKDSVGGVFFGVIDVATFSIKFVDQVKVGESGYAYIYDQRGFVIAHPDKTLILDLNMNDLSFGKEMVAMGSGYMEYEWKDVVKSVAFEKDNLLGWTVGVGAKNAELLAPVKSLGAVNLSVTLIVVCAAVAVILFLVRSTTKPINAAVARLKDIAQGDGDLTQRLEVTTRDEIGEMATWFNTFLQNLQAMMEDIADNAGTLSNSSTKLASISQQMSDGAEKTSEATMEIKKQIEEVQGATRETVTDIGEISAVIGSVDEIVSTIAAAVEEQSVTTQDIAGNIAQASSGIQEVSTNVAQSSQVTESITSDIAEVNQLSNEMTTSSSQVNISAEDLSGLAEKINGMVGKFKV